MVTLIEGRIGSGKSYFAVRDVLLKYYRFDEEKVHWVLRDDIQDVAIYTNIDGFWVANNLDDAIKAAGGLEAFFTESYQKKFTKLKRHVYVIDEAQKATLFHKKFYNPDVFYVFEYSRHFGIEFFLITQDIWKLSPGLTGLPEIHIRVQRRSLSLFKNSFVYMYMSGSDVIRRKTLKADPRIFAAYRSQRVGVPASVGSFSRRYFVIFILLFCLVSGSFYAFIKSFSWTFARNVPVVNKDKVAPPVVNERVLVGVVSGVRYYKNSKGIIIKE